MLGKTYLRSWHALPLACLLFLCVHLYGALLSPAHSAQTFSPNTAIHSGRQALLFWQKLSSGMELSCSSLRNDQEVTHSALVILRLIPERFQFSLHMASEEGTAKSLPEWGIAHGLLAGINASMYLQDNLTSTGHMRSGTHINNDHIGSRLGGFFLAEPHTANLPYAMIIEAEDPRLAKLLPQYGIVIQNYRLISKTGEILWKDTATQHSIAAIAQDSMGRILFIFSQQPVSAPQFAAHLQQLKLGLTTVIYVEGGSPAGLFFTLAQQDFHIQKALSQAHISGELRHARSNHNTDAMYYIIKGKQHLFRTTGSADATLPNILGIKQRHTLP